jgi:hypothetical protein
MTGPPTARLATRSAPSVNRASQTVMVRMHDGDLAGRVSADFAMTLLASGAAQPIGKMRLRYLRLEPGIVLRKSLQGWRLIEEQREKYGDNAVRRGVMTFDHGTLKWQSARRP